MYAAASTQRSTAVVGPTRAGVASTQRSAAATAEAPNRWCPATNKPIVTSCQTGNTVNTPPRFPAVSRGGYCPPLQVEVRSGSPVSFVRESTAEACGFEIVIDEFGYDDYVEVDQPFELPPGIVGLSCFMLIHDGYELCFDGFVIDDDSFDTMAHTDVDILAGASFMESNDVAVRPSRHRIMFGDRLVYPYSVSGSTPSLNDTGETETESVPAKAETATECERSAPVTACAYCEIVFEWECTETTVYGGCEIATVYECCETFTEYECSNMVTECERSATVMVYEGCETVMENECLKTLTDCAHNVVVEFQCHDDELVGNHNLETAAVCEHETDMCSAHLGKEYFGRDFTTDEPTGRSEFSGQLDQCLRGRLNGNPYFPAQVTSQVDCLSPAVCDIGYGTDSPGFVSAEQVLDCLWHGSGSLGVEYDSDVHHNGNTRPFSVPCNPKGILMSDNIVHLPSLSDVLATDHTSCAIPQCGIPEPSQQYTDSEDALSPDDGVTFHSTQTRTASDNDHTIGPDEASLTLPHTSTVRVILCPHTDVIPKVPLTHDCFCEIAGDAVLPVSDQVPAAASGTKPTDHPPCGHATESYGLRVQTEHLPVSSIDDHLHVTSADYDTLGLHFLLDGVGSAYFDMSLPWTLSPWTCGPRPPSFIAEGGPVPSPHDGASRPSHLLMTAICPSGVLRAPTLGVTDLATVDVTRPPVPRITGPPAPPVSTGLTVSPHPPMSPFTPG